MYIRCATMTTKILRTHFAKLNSVPRQQEFLVLPLNSWQAPTLNPTTLGTHVGSMEFVLFSDWLTSLGVMSSKLIRVVACVRIPATLRSVVYSRALCLSMPRSHQQIFGRLHLSAWPEETLLSVLLGIYPGVELLRHMVMLLLILGNIELFSVELHHLEFC